MSLNPEQMFNKEPKRWYELRNASNNNADEVELLIYGDIVSDSYWNEGVVAKELIKQLQASTAKTIKLYINSPGGNVYAGKAIFNALKRHSATKCVYIDGIAASIASIIAMAGDEIHIPANATLMIHNPSSIAWGEAKDFIKAAGILESEKKALISIYQTKTKLTEEEISQLMDAETWMIGQEAIDKGLATHLLQNSPPENFLNLNLSGFEHIPEQIVNYAKSTQTPQSSQEHEMTPEEIQNLINDQIKKAVEPMQAELQQTKAALTTAADTIKNLETENTAAKAKQQAETERQTGINDLFALFNSEPSMYAAHYAKLQAACLSDGSTVADTRKKLIDLRSKFASQAPAKGALNANLDFADEPADVGNFDTLVSDKVKNDKMSLEDAIEWAIENHPQAYKLSLKKANPPKENE